MRLIDADALINRMYHDAFETDTDMQMFENAIDQAPTIDAVEVVRGEWIDMGDFEQCSVCKGTRLKEFQTYYGKATWIKTNFCPNCGAKMKGADDE